jgi:UDP-N-acetylglucosamine 1-carboxyvinyltransferase
LLRDIGVKTSPPPSKEGQKGSYPLETFGTASTTFQADDLNLDFLTSDEFVEKCAQLRGSVMMIGPLLARMGKAVIAKPGGDKIGRRRLDTHFLGFQKLGAKFRQLEDRSVYEIFAKSPKSKAIRNATLCSAENGQKPTAKGLYIHQGKKIVIH